MLFTNVLSHEGIPLPVKARPHDRTLASFRSKIGVRVRRNSEQRTKVRRKSRVRVRARVFKHVGKLCLQTPNVRGQLPIYAIH